MLCIDAWVTLAGARHALVTCGGHTHLDRVLGDLPDEYVSPAAASALSVCSQLFVRVF
jgi:hypothetical protein